MMKSDKEKLVQSLLSLAVRLPGPSDRFSQDELLQLDSLEKIGWVWYNLTRNEWKVTREGEKIYAEATSYK